jgi:uncharacterized repeat protein (TIGR03803 family)
MEVKGIRGRPIRRWMMKAILFGVLGADPAGAFQGSVAYGFGPYPDGSMPVGNLIIDASGRLYGVTQFGGTQNLGVVFRLTKPASGSGPWTEEILHTFSGGDGMYPSGRLLLGSAGEIYGTTVLGGAYAYNPQGTIYRLDNSPGWPLTVLHTFPGVPYGKQSADGCAPVGGLAFGPDGLLYGVAASCAGPNSGGMAFSISPLGDATEYAVLHRFDDKSLMDGQNPLTSLIGGVAAVFLGTTQGGGPGAGGTIYRLLQDSSGRWTENILYSFSRLNGTGLFNPTTAGGLVHGSGGQYYGCALQGGTHGQGGVFSVAPPAAGGTVWTETTLYNFGSQPNDPVAVYGCGLSVSSSGQLIGADGGGGAYGVGALFQLTPPAAGQTDWTETVLHSFGKLSPGGSFPGGGPLRIGGLYYGVNEVTPNANGAASGSGSVFEFRP